jgi:glycosyltransferase involved in cell wall biosynthesis
MISQPLVSVLMPAYNRQQYIEEAIDAVLASSYTNFELIIVDDHSVDNTLTIAHRYASKDDRVKVFQNERNLDQFPNRNRAASLASGSIIFCADSDDTIFPDALQYIVDQFEAFPDINFATLYMLGDIDAPTVIKSNDAVRRNFLEKEFLLIGPAGTIIRTHFFNKIGRFPEAYGPAGDLYYNVRAACHSDVLLLPYVFFNYRRHEGQEINKKYSYLYNNYKYFSDIMQLPEMPFTKEEKDRLLAKNNRNFLFQTMMYAKGTGEFKETLKAYKLAGFGWREFVSGILKMPLKGGKLFGGK